MQRDRLKAFRAALSACVAALLLAAPFFALSEKADGVLFIHIGKGDAALVRAGGRDYLIDTGKKKESHRLLAALDRLRVSELAGVFITHQDADHLGGLKVVAPKIPIRMVYLPHLHIRNRRGSNRMIEACEKLGLPYTLMRPGDTADGLFTALAPIVLDELDDNDNSLVLRFSLGGLSYLMTGDMQTAEEETLLKTGQDLACDVLKVGNHGNPDATCDAFARAVRPRVSIVSTDTAVDTNSAHPDVLKRLGGSRIYLTQQTALGLWVTAQAGEALVQALKEDGTFETIAPYR